MPKAKQPRSRGSIQARGRNKWLARVYLGTDEITGKRKYLGQIVMGTRRDAERALTELLSKADNKEIADPNKITVKSHCEAWLLGKRKLSQRTRGDYQAKLEKWVYPLLGDKKLQALSDTDIENFVSHLETVTGKRTIQYSMMVLSQALDQALRKRLISSNPCQFVELPSYKRKPVQVLDAQQVQTLLDRTKGDKWHPLWVLLLTTGMRPQEALALKWSDIVDGEARIQRTLVRVDDTHYEVSETTKTEKSSRPVALPSSTVGILQEHRIKQLQEALKAGPSWDRKGNWVFTNTKGGWMDPSKVRKLWKKALKAAGLPAVRLYDSRHTHATLLLGAGENPKIVAERLGHSTVNLTLNTYSHVLPEMQRETANKVESLVFGVAGVAR